MLARWRGGYTYNGGEIWASLKPAEVQAAPLREAKYTVAEERERRRSSVSQGEED